MNMWVLLQHTFNLLYDICLYLHICQMISESNKKYKKRCNWGFLGLEKGWGKHHFDILNFPNTIYI